VPPAACPHQRTPIAPSWPPRIIAVTSEIRTGQRQELFFEVPSSFHSNAQHRFKSAHVPIRLFQIWIPQRRRGDFCNSIGTSRTLGDVHLESAKRAKADIDLAALI
jgi:hypothetical protein